MFTHRTSYTQSRLYGTVLYARAQILRACISLTDKWPDASVTTVRRATLARLCLCHSVLGELEQALQARAILVADYQQRSGDSAQDPAGSSGDIYPDFFQVEVSIFLKSKRFHDARTVLQQCLNHPKKGIQGVP